jgi:hypothetical protein
MNESVLEKRFPPIERPFSQQELEIKRYRLKRKLHIGKVLIKHDDCGHFYLTKSNGRKEKEAISSDYKNIGNCSVCWKLARTPRFLKNRAYKLVEEYGEHLACEPSRWIFELVELEEDFYTWLYIEFNPKSEKFVKNSKDSEETAI